MPTYNFLDTETDVAFSEFMTFSERDEFLEAHPHVVPAPPNQVNIVRGVSGLTYRNDDGWNENLQRISEAHPGSELADVHGDKSIKAAKTREAVKKWRKRREKSGDSR